MPPFLYRFLFVAGENLTRLEAVNCDARCSRFVAFATCSTNSLRLTNASVRFEVPLHKNRSDVLESSISVVDARRVNIARVMSMLPDDTYDAFVIDATEDETQNIVRLELTVTSGEHKGEVVSLRAANLARDAIDLIGLPAQLHVREGRPSVTFD